MFTKYKTLTNFDRPDEQAATEVTNTDHHNLLMLPAVVWKRSIINLDHLLRHGRKTSSRVQCYGPVVFFDKDGRLVAKGDMRDLNEKSGGFEIDPVDLKVNDTLFLEFLNSRHFVLSQVAVVLRRVQSTGRKIKIGVEFVEATPVFQERLNQFLAKIRAEFKGFNDIESI